MNDLALYNEIDEFAADWLENLIRAGHIAPGIVDRRSVLDLTPDDLLRYRQVHLFAGIGIWSASMRDAGIRDDDPWWSASCPCQPFSQAGQGGGFDDERHLWPAAYHLISQCRPPKVVGEQVASPDGLHWIDLVSADMEGAAYAFTAFDLCAAGVAIPAGETDIGKATVEWIRGAIQSCPDPFLAAELRDYAEWFSGQVGVGAPHIRQRLYWMADANGTRCGEGRASEAGARAGSPRVEPAGLCVAGTMADANCRQCDGIAGGEGCERDGSSAGRQQGNRELERSRAIGAVADADSERCDGIDTRLPGPGQSRDNVETAGCRQAVQLADAQGGGQPMQRNAGEPGRERHADSGGTPGFWANADWIVCTDGQARPVEVGTFPLAHGERSRVGKLRAYGNQICRPLATTFLQCCAGG